MLKRLCALAALTLVLLCPMFASAGDGITGKDGLPFNEIAFAHQDGKVQFRSLTAQDEDGDVNLMSKVAFGGEDQIDLYLNGKKVTDAQLEQWASKTVNARVRVDEKTESLHFFGGTPVVDPTVTHQTGPAVLGPTPLTLPLRPVFPQTQPGCPGGRCPTPRRD